MYIFVLLGRVEENSKDDEGTKSIFLVDWKVSVEGGRRVHKPTQS